MKALLVADDEKAINNISEVLKAAGYDTIVYTWLLKALDNIEEIAPHLIIVSTGDYPRHWKTLAQYATAGFGEYKPQIILYTDENFNEEEHKKAEALHVRGTFDSVTVEGLDKLREILKKADDIFSGYLTEEEQSEISVDDLVPNAKKFVEAEIEEVQEKPEESISVENKSDELEESEKPIKEILEESEIEESTEEESFDELSNKVEATESAEEVCFEDSFDELSNKIEATESVGEVNSEDSFDELSSKVEATQPLGEVNDEDSFDELANMVEETNDGNQLESEEQTLEEIQDAEAEAIADEQAASRLEEIENDERAADRLEEITGDDLAADRLEEIAEDEKIADKMLRLSDNEEIPTVQAILNEPYDESESTALPGIEELKELLDENNFEESENNDIIDDTEITSEEDSESAEITETEQTDGTSEINEAEQTFQQMDEKSAEPEESENQEGETNMADEQSIEDKLAEIMNANKADQKEKAEALKLDTSSTSVAFVFTNPITLAMVSGVARNYNGLVLEFTPDIPNFIMNLSPGTKIDIASMKIDDKIENVFAEVMSNDAKKLALAIKKIS